MKERIRVYFRELVELQSASGAEQAVIEYMYHHLEKIADTISVSPIGNLNARLKGNASGPHLMLCAHADEIGFVVKNILEDGFLTFEKLGGVADPMIPGRSVIVGSSISGVIGVRPAHLRQRQIIGDNSILHSYIDVGAFSREEAHALGIRIGDRVVYDSPYRQMADGQVICSRSVDNKINLAILIVLFEELAGKQFPGTVTAGVSVQEEFSLKGAGCLAQEVNPDYSIVIDTIPAGDTPDIDTEKELPVYLGKGPACPLSDGYSTGIHYTVVNKKVQDFIDSQAGQRNINLQHLTVVEDAYISDASAIAYAGTGIPVGIVAVPRRYSHSPVEVFHLSDACDSLKLLKGIVESQKELDLRFIDL